MSWIRDLMDEMRRKVQESRARDEALRQFEDALVRALADGRLSDEELAELEARRTAIGLDAEAWARLRGRLYGRAVREVTADRRLSQDEEAALLRLREYFGVSEAEVAHRADELARYRLLAEIEAGRLPEVDAPGLVLRRGEVVHWVEPGELLEERTVRRRYGGSSHGVSFRIARGVYYRVGGHGGQVVTEREVVPVSQGELVLSNQRLVFRGNHKNFTARWDQVIDLDVFADGLRVSREGRQKPVLIRLPHRDNAEVVAMVCSALVNTG